MNSKKSDNNFDTSLVPGVGRTSIPAYRGNEDYIFVSYAHSDSEIVFPEIKRLNDLGYHVWYDEGISPGNEWADEIASVLENCKAFIVFFTPNSEPRQNVRNEIDFAINEGKNIVAVHLAETVLTGSVKLRIGSKQAIMKYNMSDEEYDYKIVSAMERFGLKREETDHKLPDGINSKKVTKTEDSNLESFDNKEEVGNKSAAKSKKIKAFIISFSAILVVLAIIAFSVLFKPFSSKKYIEFGRYPQTRLTDEKIIEELNRKTQNNKDWKSYEYYSAFGEGDDGNMKPSDYMRYIDIEYSNKMYRGVIFDSFRPEFSSYPSNLDPDYSSQDENGYLTSTVYWFIWEPIRWSYLNDNSDILICNSIIDAQPFHNYTLCDKNSDDEHAYFGNKEKNNYASNYYESDIRYWLNNSFYNDAFNNEEKSSLLKTILNNECFEQNRDFSCEDTEDYIFLISHSEVETIDKTDKNRVNLTVNGTDYAQCQGVSTSESGSLPWLLRTAGFSSNTVCTIEPTGDTYKNEFYFINYVSGVRPAIRINH